MSLGQKMKKLLALESWKILFENFWSFSERLPLTQKRYASLQVIREQWLFVLGYQRLTVAFSLVLIVTVKAIRECFLAEVMTSDVTRRGVGVAVLACLESAVRSLLLLLSGRAPSKSWRFLCWRVWCNNLPLFWQGSWSSHFFAAHI